MTSTSSASTSSASAVQAAYDRVAAAYDERFSDELVSKPLDRALLTAFVELVADGPIADVGCGPGHVTRFLGEHHPDVIGIDLSPGMVAIARQRAPGLTFTVGSMTGLQFRDAAWAGIVALYSIIHLRPDERMRAYREFARLLRPGGWLLVAFHVDSAEFAVGAVNRLTEWFGQPVQLDGYFLDPVEVVLELEAAGLSVRARVERQPTPGTEYPSRRCYVLAQHPPNGPADDPASEPPDVSGPTLTSVGWIHVRDGRLLAVRTRGRDRFYLPGGKLEAGESQQQALIREVREELGVTLGLLRPAFTVAAPAHGLPAPTDLTMHCFHAEPETDQLNPAREVAEIAWLEGPEDRRAAPAVREVLRRVLGTEKEEDAEPTT